MLTPLLPRLTALAVTLTLAGMAAAFPAPAHADAFEEIASFSSLGDKLEREKVDKGEIVSGRVSGITAPRGQIVECVFRVEAPISKTIDAWKEWNGTRHPDLKVYLHGDLNGAGTIPEYAKLASSPNVPSVRTLAAATAEQEGVDRDVQMNKSEVALYSRKNTAANGTLSTAQATFWASLLNARAHAYFVGGLPAQLPYNTPHGDVSAAAELKQLLGEAPKIQGRFKRLLDTAGVTGKPTGKPVLYWELMDADGTAAVTLGSSVSALDGQTIQAVDLQLYASGGAYTVASLTQFWPATTASGPVTIVYRADFISAARLGELRGLERTMAGSVLTKRLTRVVSYFQKDAAGSNPSK